jgi:hypothetical protein
MLWSVFSTLYFIHDLRVPVLLLGVTLVSTCILPALSSYLMLRTGLIKNLEMTDRKDRLLPYLITALYYYFAFTLFENFPVPSGMIHAIRMFVLGGAGAILVTAGINLFWKISAHTVAMGGLSGAMLALTYALPDSSFGMFYSAMLCSGVVAYARLKIEAHTPSQVYTGFLLGFSSMLLLLYPF